MLDQRIMNGTCGEVWVDDELWVELESAQAKYTYNKSDINICSQSRTKRSSMILLSW